MPVFKPFRAYRPSVEDAKTFACRPFDVVDQHEADIDNAIGLSQFLKVTKPELFNSSLSDVDKHIVSNNVLNKYLNSGKFIKDDKACFYLYAESVGQHVQYGIIGCLSTDDYKNGLIKQHELTRVEKVVDRTQHILNTGFHTEPVFTTIKHNIDLELIIQDCMLLEPLYDFVTPDSITHQFWIIDNDAKIRRLQTVFETDVSALYIADGHHRSAAASLVANECGTEESKLFMAAVFPMKHLSLKGYHRLVDINKFNTAQLIDQLKIHFSIVEVGDKPVFPTDQKSFGLFVDNSWYKLILSNMQEDILEAATLFNSYIAKNIFSIENVRTTDDIEYIGDKIQLDSIISGDRNVCNKALFTLCPLDIQLLIDLSDQAYILPPKSTWFEPKLRSGLVIHSITD